MTVHVPCGNPSCSRTIYIGDPKLKPHDLVFCKRCEAIQNAMAVHAPGDLN